MLAQRAFRQRNKDAITSLEAQVNSLQKTVDDLNTCFLAFTDDLFVSGWLEKAPKVASSLQATIENFISIVHASNSHSRNHDTVNDRDESTPTSYSIAHTGPTQDANHFSVADSGIAVGSILVQGSDDTPNGVYASVNSELTKSTTKIKQDRMTLQTSRSPAQSRSFSPLYMPAYKDMFNYIPRLARQIDLMRLNFAQKLHMETIKAGLELISTAEDNSQLFFHVFSQVSDHHTRETYKRHFSRILDKYHNNAFEALPGAGIYSQWSGRKSWLWLNASEVASHFRSLGMNVDSPSGTISVEVDSSFPADMWYQREGLSAHQSFRSHGNDASITHQASTDQAYLISTVPTYNAKAAQAANDYDISSFHSLTNARSQRSRIFVDVSQLIHGEHPSTLTDIVYLSDTNPKN